MRLVCLGVLLCIASVSIFSYLNGIPLPQRTAEFLSSESDRNPPRAVRKLWQLNEWLFAVRNITLLHQAAFKGDWFPKTKESISTSFPTASVNRALGALASTIKTIPRLVEPVFPFAGDTLLTHHSRHADSYSNCNATGTAHPVAHLLSQFRTRATFTPHCFGPSAPTLTVRAACHLHVRTCMRCL
jgi:hypothetical protein